ncbi:MAG: hypothetical protein KBA46_08135 [Candidatus Omnitrophica bacterium]|nr:hypothetical protein [Candidatus Omnitrophota bacterium]
MYCLDKARIVPEELDYVVFYDKPFVKFDRILTSCISTFPRSRRLFVKVIPLWLKERLFAGERLQRLLGDVPVIFCEHHLSHAASAFFVSPFEDSAIITVDGVGEWSTVALGHGHHKTISLEKEIRFPHSLGLLYNAITAYLGFRVNWDEYKVMALASYGKPSFRKQFEEIISLNDDGSFKLNMGFFSYDHSYTTMFSERLVKLFGSPPRSLSDPINQFHRDIAASAQEVLETALIRLARHAYSLYGLENLCIAGGVGLNCVANAKIVKQTPFKRIFIQPAAGDDGAALGAAYFAHHQLLGNERDFIMRHAYWGPEYSNKDIELFLNNKSISFEKLDEKALVEKAASCIAENKIIGWFQGRMEWGPRALGNRSILANPLHRETRTIINQKIKNRKDFQPFAASVLDEEASDMFELQESPFMLLAVKVKEHMLSRLPAVVHVDGTCRIQTVSQDTNELFYALLKKVKEKIGVSVLLNTSLNYADDPIACSPEDAVRCFLKTGIDCLFMGNCVLSRR